MIAIGVMKGYIKKVLCVILFVLLMGSCKSQMEISLLEYNSDVYTEWIDGKLWAYKSDENNTVGMTVYLEKDDYGQYYQISLFIMNATDEPIIFDPADVSAKLAYGTNFKKLEVYTNDEYQRKLTKKQRRDMILYGIAAGLSAGSAGYSTTYVNGYAYTTYNPSVASLASMVAANQLNTMGKVMEYEKEIKQIGYLKKNTIHPDQGISGYMNIEAEGRGVMLVEIPVENNVYSFQWYIGKKAEQLPVYKTTNQISVVDYDGVVTEEWKDGILWAYRDAGDYEIGAALCTSSDDDSNYQLKLSIKPEGGSPVTINTDGITAQLANGRIVQQLGRNNFSTYKEQDGQSVIGYIERDWSDEGIIKVDVPVGDKVHSFQWGIK